VSTILKSLKKVEKEKESIAVQETGMLSPLKMRTSMHDPVRFAWLKRKFVQFSILGIAVLAGAAVLYIYSRSTSESVSQAKTEARIGTEPVGRSDSSRPIAPARHEDEPRFPENPPFTPSVAPSTTPPGHTPPGRGAPARSAPAIAAGSPSLGPDSATEENPPGRSILPQQPGQSALAVPVQPQTASAVPTAGSAADVSREAYEESSEMQRNVASKADAGRPKSQIRQFAGAERMTDGRLKVQAIVWADNAEDRMAVVNNRIVREGTVLEGFSIVGIGQDALFVSEAGRLLSVPFGNR
jgi:hypothetical protein